MTPETRVVVPAFELGTEVSEALAEGVLVLEACALVLEAAALEEPVEELVEVADPLPPEPVPVEVEDEEEEEEELELVLVAVDRVVGVSVLEGLDVLVVFSTDEVVVEAASVVVAEAVVDVEVFVDSAAPATTKRGR